MLRVLNLEAGYGPLRVLKGISLHVSAGEAVAIIGATLLVAITGATALLWRSPANRSGSAGGAASSAKVVFGPGGPRTLHLTLPGPSYDTALGVDLVLDRPALEAHGQVRLTGRGSWVCYRDFNFSPEVDFINLCVAGEATDPKIWMSTLSG